MRRRPRDKEDATPRGGELVELFLTNQALVVGTEEGYKDVEEGRVVRLADLKKQLGDV